MARDQTRPQIADKKLRRKFERYEAMQSYSWERNLVSIITAGLVGGLIILVLRFYLQMNWIFVSTTSGGIGGLSGALLGRWIWRKSDIESFKKAISENSTLCTECGYDLRGATGTNCSECGKPIVKPERISVDVDVSDTNNKDMIQNGDVGS